MPVFPAQGGSRNTWGTELRNFFSPYFTLTTGLFVTASIPAWAIDATIAWTQIVKTTASLADINNHDHSTLTSIGTNNHMAIDAFIASASTSPGASMIPITTTTSMLVLPGNVLLPNTAALKIKNATGSQWYAVVAKASDAVYVGDVDKFATGHIYFSGTTSQNFIRAVSQTGADTVVYHSGNVGLASSVATLNASSLVVQNPTNASATPGANQIPILDASGNFKLASSVVITSVTGTLGKNLISATGTDTVIIGKSISDLSANVTFDGTDWRFIQTGSASIIRSNYLTGTDAVVVYLASATGTAGSVISWGGPYKIHHDNNSGLWVDYSTSSTVVGWSAYAYKYIHYTQVGKIGTVKFAIYGTSNSTAISLTIPLTQKNDYAADAFCRSIDNGAAATAPGYVTIAANSSTINAYKDNSGATWTASGAKSISGTLVFEIA